MTASPLNTEDGVAEEESVRGIVTEALGESPVRVAPVPVQGNVNRSYEAETLSGSFVVRVRFHRQEISDYLNEKQCAEIVRASHDWTPEIVAVGVCAGHAYSIQRKVSGTVATRYQGDLAEIWEQIGRYARVVHAVKTPGYLYNCFSDVPLSEQPWCQWYFDYLGSADDSLLISRGLLSRGEFEAALHALTPLKDLVFEPTLAHGNITLSNIIVDHAHKAHLIDWGTCQGHMGTELDLAELLLFETPAEHVRAYLRGHGLSDSYIDQHRDVLERLQLGRAFTSAKWLCDRKSTGGLNVLSFIEKIRIGVQRIG